MKGVKTSKFSIVQPQVFQNPPSLSSKPQPLEGNFFRVDERWCAASTFQPIETETVPAGPSDPRMTKNWLISNQSKLRPTAGVLLFACWQTLETHPINEFYFPTAPPCSQTSLYCHWFPVRTHHTCPLAFVHLGQNVLTSVSHGAEQPVGCERPGSVGVSHRCGQAAHSSVNIPVTSASVQMILESKALHLLSFFLALGACTEGRGGNYSNFTCKYRHSFQFSPTTFFIVTPFQHVRWG